MSVLLGVLKSMVPGEERDICPCFPGVCNDQIVVKLTSIENSNYHCTFYFCGIFLKKGWFYDFKGELVEVPTI